MTEQFDKTSFNCHERHRPHERTTTAGSWIQQTRGNALGIPRLLVILAMALAIALQLRLRCLMSNPCSGQAR